MSKWAVNSLKNSQKTRKKLNKAKLKEAKKLRKEQKSNELMNSLSTSNNIINGNLSDKNDWNSDLQRMLSKSEENSVVKSFTLGVFTGEGFTLNMGTGNGNAEATPSMPVTLKCSICKVKLGDRSIINTS